jgi:hypothetical protein
MKRLMFVAAIAVALLGIPSSASSVTPEVRIEGEGIVQIEFSPTDLETVRFIVSAAGGEELPTQERPGTGQVQISTVAAFDQDWQIEGSVVCVRDLSPFPVGEEGDGVWEVRYVATFSTHRSLQVGDHASLYVKDHPNGDLAGDLTVQADVSASCGPRGRSAVRPLQSGYVTVRDVNGPVSAPHSTGLVDPASGEWFLFDGDGVLTTSFFFGNPGDFPIMGDWDCDGVETPGMYRQSDGFVYLRNSNTQGVADIKFFFGDPGDVPLAGDFNGDGCGTVSIYRPSNQTFYIINKLGENNGGLGAAETSYVFGDPGDKAFVGDFNGNGEETVGLHRESTGLVYFRNSHTQGNADNQFIFGDPNDRLIAGDWNNDVMFSPALFRPSNVTTFFRYTNTQGNADNRYIPTRFGTDWLPVAGMTN